MFVVIMMSLLNISGVDALGYENRTNFEISGQLENAISFEQLGYIEKLMVGPFDSSNVFFSLPANIKLATGSSVLVNYAAAWSGTTDTSSGAGSILGTLLVYFNDELIDTIILDGSNESSKQITIPEKAFVATEADGRHRLRFVLSADVNCRFDNFHTTVIISKSSLFSLQYEAEAPAIDLSILPRPIFLPNSIVPSSTLIVVPDTPEAFELQSALTISAGLGSLTGGEMALGFATNGSLTPDIVASNHLIFVGLGSKFPNLRVADMPFSVGDDTLALPKSNEQDGVIQIAQSPWSQSNVVLYIGGNSEESVVKAAQVFSTGSVVAVEKPDVSLISTVNTDVNQGPVLVDRTFKDLGYESQTAGLFGESFLTYLFEVSAEQAVSTGGYVDLVISHSDLLDVESTGMTVILNDEVVGGVRLNEETPMVTRIDLSPDVLRRGMNRLEIVSDIVPYYTCYSTDLLSTWITISESSIIHLPVTEQQLGIGSNTNLRDYPYMFLTTTNLSDLAVVLPQNDLVSWAAASNALFYVGAKGEMPIVGLNVMYSDNVPDEFLQQYNILTFGRSSNLEFLVSANDSLPAPFKDGSDEAVQPSMLVNYSLLPDTSVGYLQLLSSPWNSDRVLLAVLGNTELGIPMAGLTLTKDESVSKLNGDFAIIYQDQIVTTDTRLGISREGIVSELPVAVTVTPSIPPVSSESPPQAPVEIRPNWILPAIMVTTVFMVIALIILVYKTRKGRDTVNSEDASIEESEKSNSD
jgi:hypothetical protein